MKNQTNQNPDKVSSPVRTAGGIIFLQKKPGVTSFQALGRIKRVLGTRKVGHTGTLDKFAEGLLIILTGKLTRLNSIITGMDKTYEALIRFGRETDTLDPEGDTVAEAPLPSIQVIQEQLKGFLGKISQKPPLYSAIHIDGKRAHALARSGQTVDMPAREIQIYNLEILEFTAPDLLLRVHCSKGTYIRSLARDLGIACGSRAYVQELKRTKVGSFQLQDAVDVEAFRGEEDFFSWEKFFLSLGNSQISCVNAAGLEKMNHGVPFSERFLTEPLQGISDFLLLKDVDGNLKAVLEYKGGKYKYKINLAG